MMRAAGAIAAGLGILIGVVIVSFVVALLSGLVGRSEGEIDLTGWLWVEVIAGGVGAVLAGWACARIARRWWPVLVLAGLLMVFGALEALEILMSANVRAPVWLVLGAPLVGAGGVLAGGWLGRDRGGRGAASVTRPDR